MEDAFCYSTTSTSAALERLLRRYERDGRAITVNFRQMVSCLGSPDRATHLIHPYPAKLLMHIPFFFLANTLISHRGSRVLDPFCGSGTVLLESLLSGRTAVGFDTNPLACLVSQVKTTSLPERQLQNAANSLLSRIAARPTKKLPDVVNMRHWFYPHVSRQLQCISEAIHVTRNSDVRDFFRVAFSQCVRKVSLADPRLAVPVRLKAGQYPAGHPFREKSDSRLQWLRRVDVQDVFAQILNANLDRVATLSANSTPLPSASIHCCDARLFNNGSAIHCTGKTLLADETIDLIITSPPYPGAQKYIRSVSLSLGWLEICPSDSLIDLKHATIGREEFPRLHLDTPVSSGVPTADKLLQDIWQVSPIRATIAGTYLNEMRDVLRHSFRVLRKGGHLVLVVANNRIAGHNFKTQQYLTQIAENLGFRTLLRLTDAIRSRGLMTKRNRTASVISRESVLVFAKQE